MEIIRHFPATIFILGMVMNEPANAENEFALREQVAVTPLAGLEDFYVRIKNEIPFTYVDDGHGGHLRKEDSAGVIHYKNFQNLNPPIVQRFPIGTQACYDLWQKSYVCTRIFNSAFFKMRNEKAVHFSVRTFDTMETLHNSKRDFFDIIYRNWPRDRTEWLNPYHIRDVRIGDRKLREHVFACITQHHEGETYAYKGYFISPVYQSSSVANPMNGRFVFSVSNKNSNEMMVLAMAEEPAVRDESILEETLRAYYNARKDKHPDEDVSSNPVCQFPTAEKIRLCAVVMNATQFPENVEFQPTMDNIEAECRKNKVLAHIRVERIDKNIHDAEEDVEMIDDEYTKEYKWISVRVEQTDEEVRGVVEMTYDEHMIGCKAILDNADDLYTYYVSQGLASHSAIVFKPSVTGDTFIPHVGVSAVNMIFGSGSIKNVRISAV